MTGCIEPIKTQMNKVTHTIVARILAFKSAILRNEFLENFSDLTETAKPLL